ncbi:putative uncharacterized protein DDB_G0277255 [Solanum pennellii]|uniref:C2 domain-containing protein n=1 Tax=Solanum pennellii TaxID=28526 RepID=A0ABM1GTQ9_SOLPN|nr:putative uncharacterized protein DDB_G0277255 [Solanum pennellii]
MQNNSNKTHTHIISFSFSLDAIANLYHHLLLLVAATDGDNNTTMDPKTTTTLVIPTPQSSSLSYQPSPSNNNNSHILEITLISAQDLAPISKSLRTYALTWINPNRKRSTKIDNEGHNNPTWNDKFSFKVNEEFLYSENSAVHVEIYTVSWFRDVLVGTINVQLNNLINPYVNFQNSSNGKRFVALQIRRPSGNPQGILNMGVAIIESSMRSMPLLCNEIMDPTSLDYRDILDKKMSENYQEVADDDKQREINEKVQLWRSMSLGYSEIKNDELLIKGSSICNGSMANGSMVNGSELCSDVGPSASIVAAEIAAKRYQQLLPTIQSESREVETKKSKEMEDGERSLILEDLTAEEAYAKGLLSSNREKLRKETTATQTQTINGGHARRNSDGGGLFSCFGNAYGIEFRIVCGANNNNNNNDNNNKNNNNNVGNSSRNIPNNSNKGRKKWSSETNSA